MTQGIVALKMTIHDILTTVTSFNYTFLLFLTYGEDDDREWRIQVKGGRWEVKKEIGMWCLGVQERNSM